MEADVHFHRFVRHSDRLYPDNVFKVLNPLNARKLPCGMCHFDMCHARQRLLFCHDMVRQIKLPSCEPCGESLFIQRRVVAADQGVKPGIAWRHGGLPPGHPMSLPAEGVGGQRDAPRSAAGVERAPVDVRAGHPESGQPPKVALLQDRAEEPLPGPPGDKGFPLPVPPSGRPGV